MLLASHVAILNNFVCDLRNLGGSSGIDLIWIAMWVESDLIIETKRMDHGEQTRSTQSVCVYCVLPLLPFGTTCPKIHLMSFAPIRPSCYSCRHAAAAAAASGAWAILSQSRDCPYPVLSQCRILSLSL